MSLVSGDRRKLKPILEKVAMVHVDYLNTHYSTLNGLQSGADIRCEGDRLTAGNVGLRANTQPTPAEVLQCRLERRSFLPGHVERNAARHLAQGAPVFPQL